MENFTAIRNGIREHIKAGKLSPFDFGIFVFLQLGADWSTGIYVGCAKTIAYQFGDHTLKADVQKSLRRLRDKEYINYRNGDGKRKGYPILIHKYEPTVGEQSGTRLNAWKHGSKVLPEYEPQNGQGTVGEAPERSRNGGGTVGHPAKCLETRELAPPEHESQNGQAKMVEPIQDLRPKRPKDVDAGSYADEAGGIEKCWREGSQVPIAPYTPPPNVQCKR
jgi:hypothetical protein